ncbi:STAS domain-containing protein [Micromonospora sp. WMMD730]|uniref:STAS domain-containing protein n=1 Tax=Micromonospora sp. WMMD730 TaxID=3404128 RepID=UPI003B9575DE
MSVDRSDPGAPVLSVGGELAYATSRPVRVEVDRVLVERPTVVVFDFSGLTFIDSTGLSVIVHAWREGQRVGTLVRLRAVPRFLTTILDMTGITGLLARQLPQRSAPAPQRPAASA